jgi:hypothetical protein
MVESVRLPRGKFRTRVFGSLARALGLRDLGVWGGSISRGLHDL